MSATRLRNRSLWGAFLCYHSIAPEGPRWLSVPPDLFERQLRALARMGLTTGGRADLDGIADGGRPRRPTVFLTFDDGFRDNHAHALPLLREYRARALVFILPPAVDSGAPLDWPEVHDEVRAHPDVMRSLDWPMVEEMAAAGVDFGSHGRAHPSFPTLGDEQLRQELLDSRRAIEARLGRCDTLAYPFGHWDARVSAAAADAGYRYAFTAPRQAQTHADALSIPRVPVDRRDSLPRFALKLSPAGRRLWLSNAMPLVRRLATRHGA